MTNEIAIPIEQGEVVCGEVEQACRCVLTPHDGGPHQCACGGSWEIKDDGSFVAHSLPGSDDEWPGPGPDDYLPVLFNIFGGWS